MGGDGRQADFLVLGTFWDPIIFKSKYLVFQQQNVVLSILSYKNDFLVLEENVSCKWFKRKMRLFHDVSLMITPESSG